MAHDVQCSSYHRRRSQRAVAPKKLEVTIEISHVLHVLADLVVCFMLCFPPRRPAHLTEHDVLSSTAIRSITLDEMPGILSNR